MNESSDEWARGVAGLPPSLILVRVQECEDSFSLQTLGDLLIEDEELDDAEIIQVLMAIRQRCAELGRLEGRRVARAALHGVAAPFVVDVGAVIGRPGLVPAQESNVEVVGATPAAPAVPAVPRPRRATEGRWSCPPGVKRVNVGSDTHLWFFKQDGAWHVLVRGKSWLGKRGASTALLLAELHGAGAAPWGDAEELALLFRAWVRESFTRGFLAKDASAAVKGMLSEWAKGGHLAPDLELTQSPGGSAWVWM
jgi:hypothetical protein